MIAGAALCLSSPAPAQTGLMPQALPMPPAPSSEWRVSMGAGALLSPNYPGSGDLRLTPLVNPEISWRGDTLFLSVRDGLGMTLLRSGATTAGGILRVRFGRDQDDDDALRGMGDIRPAGEAGVFLRHAGRDWCGSVELRQGFGGHSGLVSDARLDRVVRLRPDLILAMGPRLSWGSRDFAETYFGVDAAQSRRSGNERFAPRDYWFAGAAASLTWIVAERWSLTGFGELGRILGDAADSPLVDRRGSATQGLFGLAVTWQLSP